MESDGIRATASQHPGLNVQELARPEPIRASEFVDPLLLHSLAIRPDGYGLNPQVAAQYPPHQMTNAFPNQHQPWVYPLMSPMQFDLRSFYSYLPAPPLRNPPQHEEKDRDSGNETSSLSPGSRTPPSSIPSR